MFNITSNRRAVSKMGHGLSRDEVFHLLRNRRRRFTLHFLKQEESAELGEIAEQVAAWENDVDIAAITANERKRVYNSLQQTHLPELNDSGLIEYDARSGHVTITEAASQLDVYLEVTPHDDIPWSEYYLGVSAIGVALVLLLEFSVYPFAVMPSHGWLAFIVATLSVSSLAHTYYQRKHRLGADQPPPEAGDP